MFKRKKHSKQNQRGAAGHIADKAAIAIAGFIERMQRRFAAFMNKRTNGFSARTWKILIVLFAIAWCALSSYMLVSAFASHPTKNKHHDKQFIMKQPGNDSLAIIERIYGQQKAKQEKYHTIK